MLFAGATLGLACGEERGGLVEITAAGWTAPGGSPRVVVVGEWPRGVSTPPQCQVLEGSDREASRRFAPDIRTSLDKGTFSKEFIPEEPLNGPPADYYVRCSVTVNPGTTLSDTEPVSGRIPSASG